MSFDSAAAYLPRRRRRGKIVLEVLRYIAAGILALMLIAFLVFTRWLESRRQMPDLTIRSLEGISAVDMPAPPPPPPPEEPPPPPPETPPLPQLEIMIDSPAPAIKATLEPDVKPKMMTTDFLPSRDQPRERMSFYLRDLDSQPRLLNRPRVRYPSSLRKRGIYKGRVVLEIEISPSGVPTVLRVIDASHPELVSMARSFATRARFTPPKKDGRVVAATFQWPLNLQ
ncbi:MAG: energy transducer TonB [Verrucomicrobiota bacterium]